MVTKNLFAIACALTLSLASAKVFALAPAPAKSPVSLTAVIGSESGKERRLEGHPGYLGRVGLRGGQKVKVTLQCPSAQKGDAVLVSSLDGGEITAPAGILRVAPDGTVFFHFRAPGLPGNYRVLVQFAGQEQVLNFYVLDTEHPNNNPPRVKIVD